MHWFIAATSVPEFVLSVFKYLTYTRNQCTKQQNEWRMPSKTRTLQASIKIQELACIGKGEMFCHWAWIFYLDVNLGLDASRVLGSETYNVTFTSENRPRAQTCFKNKTNSETARGGFLFIGELWFVLNQKAISSVLEHSVWILLE